MQALLDILKFTLAGEVIRNRRFRTFFCMFVCVHDYFSWAVG